MLGQDETKQAQSSGDESIQSTIKKRLYKVCEETLLTEFPEYFYNLDNTQIVKKSTQDGKDDGVITISGNRFCFPIGDKVVVKRGSNKHVMENPCLISKLQIYCGGGKTNVGEYIKIGGKTTVWNKKQNKLVESK
jgi:hypothetical protein|tara:strand:+ start:443 stop:847 length:405 start_codon:yes stop_codon:yes gene_type:complete